MRIAAEFRPDRKLWTLDVALSAADYEHLPAGPPVSLRFVETLEQVLASVAEQIEKAPPVHLGRTRAEIGWLEQGGQSPGPGTAMPLRVRRPPGPMPIQRFWSLIDEMTDEPSGSVRLGWQQADRFTGRLRLLIASLDDPAHRRAAESALGFVSDDVWEDVRAWVVSRGQDSYTRALAEPTVVTALLGSLESQDELSLGEHLLHLQGED